MSELSQMEEKKIPDRIKKGAGSDFFQKEFNLKISEKQLKFDQL